VQYKDFVTLAPRFTRAVNLERDAPVSAAVEGYILTPTAQDVVDRLVRALGDPIGHRAWTLTGPYGSGKSAFALYLANLFGPSKAPGGSLARSILKAQASQLYSDLFDGRRKGALPPQGFCPVLITGSQEPLVGALLRASLRDIRRYRAIGRPAATLKNLDRLYSLYQKGKSVAASTVIEELASVAFRLQRSSRSQGILLLIDELGKLLEFAAREADRGDIYILQQLAEATAQFKSPGLYLITILHQSFERYAAGLRPALREEWSKVQGRFEDVAFQEPPEQLIDMLAQAIRHENGPMGRALQVRCQAIAKEAFQLGLAPQGMSKQHFVRAIVRCAPLHPLSVLALVRLCRKFGQNQRSLFAFLVSREPHGFSSFLEEDVNEKHLPLYGLADLYDYVAQAFGNGLTVGEGATRWAEVQSALHRCSSSTSDETEVVKTIGVLSAIGVYGELKPSREVIEISARGDRTATRNACQNLVRQSVLVFRKHSDSFAFWEGSDVDIDGRVEEAKRRLAEGVSLARRLTGLSKPRPLVAKSHSFETGTLRYFAVRFAGISEFSQATEPDTDADGLLVYCVPATQAEQEQLVELAQGSAVRERPDILVVVPRQVDALRDAVRELELLRWVEKETPELQGDAVARRELRGRVSAAESHVAQENQTLFAPGESSARRTTWFHRGIPQKIPNARTLAHILSFICNAVYPHTPRLRNELINRRSLSSAAAKARRILIAKMITHGAVERLGLSGTPPEVSMYVSVLGATKIHRREGSEWCFGAPRGDQQLLFVWKAIDTFLASCELQRRTVAELFLMLERPPFGLKMGVIPVLFCASILAHDTEVALYENGGFVYELGGDVFERLLSAPETFELRQYRIVGVRKEVFQRFAELLDAPKLSKSQDLVAIVRPLYRFFTRLPEYSKNTKSISPIADAVRTALFHAREPDALLFEGLPRACGVPPFPPTKMKGEDVSEFFRTLKSALLELQRAYDDLLAGLRKLLLQALSASDARGREMLRFRARTVMEHAVDPRLRAFILHLTDDQLQDAAWIEAIATLLVGKAPRGWTDADRARYEVTLIELVRNFRHMEALVFELTNRQNAGESPAAILRIGVTDRHTMDKEAVVVVQATEERRLAEAVIAVEECLDRLDLTSNAELTLATLGTVSRKFLSELESSASVKKPPKRQEVTHE
jgi:hypothetical protein